MILHQMPFSGNCYKIRLAAHQLGLTLDLKNYGVQSEGNTRTPEFLTKVNTNGKVPVLELDDGRRLPESGAILYYLSADTFLQPQDSWAKAEMLQWMFFEQYSHEPYIAVLRYLRHYAAAEVAKARQASMSELTAKGYEALRVMEDRLSRHAWLAGDAYSIADIALFAYTHCAEEGGFALDGYQAINAWIARVKSQQNFLPFT